MKKIDVLMDNGGGLQLQTAKYCHSYESSRMAEQCATDIREFLRSGDTSDWEGNEPQYRRESGQWDQTLNRSEIETLILAGRIIKNLGSGATARELVAELLGTEACDYVAREMERRA